MQKKGEAPNWYRLVGNAGTAFCTTLVSVSATGIPAEQAWGAALISGGILAMLSFFKELSAFGDGIGKKLANLTLL